MSARTDRLYRVLSDAARRGRLIITGHDEADVDSMASCVLLRELCAWWGITAQIALATRADRQSRRVMPRFGVTPDDLVGELKAGDMLALVDHHAPLHAGTPVACIDHHPTACPPEFAYVQIEPSGACALMVLRLMEEAGMTPSPEQTALAVTALYLDTLALRSPKVPPEEIAWARAQAQRLGLDEAWLEREGLHLCDPGRPASELAMHGKKTYTFAGARVVSTHLQAKDMTQETLEAILAQVQRAAHEEGAALWVFLLHEPLEERSTRYDVTPDGRMMRIAYDHLVSRGRDVMPDVEKMFLSREARKG